MQSCMTISWCLLVPKQETMVAMECFFIEWFGTSEDNPWGRQPVSNATEAIERASKEGGVSLHTFFLRQLHRMLA